MSKRRSSIPALADPAAARPLPGGARRVRSWLSLLAALAAPLVTPLATQAQIAIDKQVQVVAPGKWTGPRLADGQPDVQGHWSNTIGNHDNFTDPQAGTPGDPVRRRQLGPREERAPSRVSDPADGQLPYQPWARERQQEFLKYFFNPIAETYIEPLARCAPAGPIKSLFWHGYEIRQFPGYVLFLFNSGSRVIHLDGKPHLPDTIKLWNADSRGHWEGNTLVVDVGNDNGKARLARTGEFYSDNTRITERYSFDNAGQRYSYQAVVTDPTVFTRPWTVTIPARRYNVTDTPSGWHYEVFPARHAGKERIVESYERTCVENNAGFGDVALPKSSPKP